MLRGLIRSPGYPSRKWIEERLIDVSCTPDFAQLEEAPKQLLFVYDTVNSRRRLEKIGELLWQGFTAVPFTLLKTKLGRASFPIPLEGTNYSTIVESKTFVGSKIHRGMAPALPIKGEVWEIPSRELVSLDKEINNTVYFDRQRTKVAIPFHYYNHSKERGDFITVRQVEIVKPFMYVGRPDYWDSLVTDVGRYRPVDTFGSNNPLNGFDTFYFWTPKEYES